MAGAAPGYTGDTLIQCAHSGDVDKFDAVVRSGIDVSYRSKRRGTSVLHAAAISVDEKMMLHLLEKHRHCVKSGMLPDKQKGFNALHHWCANHGDKVVFDKLIAVGFDLKGKTVSGKTVLELAKETNNNVLVKHIEDYLTGPLPDTSLPLTPLHKGILNGDAFECLNMIENNNGADVMKQASNGSAEIPPDIQKRLPQLFTSMELAFYLDNYQVLPMLVKYTDNYIIDKCLKSSLGKTNEAIIRGIRGKLSHEHKPKHVAFGRLRDPSEHNAKNVFVVFSTTKTHGAETSIAGYRVLFRDPEICEKDGIDEGRVVLHHCHENDYFLSEDEKVLIDKAIKQDCDKLWNRHSNIRGIMSSPVKYSKGQFLRQPCVVILCLFKTFIPENELDFPTSILVDGQYVPVDVREGYFRLVGDDNPLAKHVPLKMGCTIRTNDGTARFGTLGPFVEYENRLCGLVAAHVMFSKEECQQKAKTNRSSQEHVLSDTKYGGTRVEEVNASGCSERLMLQPGNGPGANQQDVDLVCGRVIKWDYAIERDTSIDIAVVEITKKERKPQQGLFTAYEKHQFKKIGYPDMEPTFDNGKKGNPTCDPEADKHPTSVSEEAEREKSDNDKRKDHTAGNNTIIFGGVSGPTIGKYRNSSSVQFTDKVCGRTEANERYRGMHFIDNSQCGEPDCKLPPLAQRGDSGGAVFQRLEDKSLVSIGVLVAVDNTGSALVTPINPVLDYFNLRMKKFQ